MLDPRFDFCAGGGERADSFFQKRPGGNAIFKVLGRTDPCTSIHLHTHTYEVHQFTD